MRESNNSKNEFDGVEIQDEIFGVTFTFGEQVSEVDGEPIFATFGDGKPWRANFSRSLILASIKAQS